MMTSSRDARYWRAVLRDSDFAAGCPVVAATLEGDRNPAAREAAGQAFNRWRLLLAQSLRRSGIERDRSRSLAMLVVASIEGAVIVSRAQCSSAPIDHVAKDPQVRAGTRRAAKSFGDAVAETFRQVADSLRSKKP